MNNILALAELLDKHRLEIEQKDKHITELEKERDDYRTGNIEAKEFIQSHIRDPLTGHVYPRKAYCPMTELAIRDLEQQAKGLTDYANSQEQGIAAVWMISAASKLIEKADRLEKPDD